MTHWLRRPRPVFYLYCFAHAVLALACRPLAANEANHAAEMPLDPAAVTAQFIERCSAMLEAGAPVTPDHLWQNLPDEQSFPLRTLPPSDTVRQTTELYAVCRQSVVMVGKLVKCDKCDDWHVQIASGFVIGRNGVVVTNRHVIDEDDEVKAIAVQTWHGRLVAVKEVLAVSKTNDLAVLRIDADDLLPLPISPEAPVGTRVFVIGHPDKQFYTMTNGLLSGHFLRREGKNGPQYGEITITADFAKGSSGAPILDARGAVVGIVRRTTPVCVERSNSNQNYAQMVWKRCVPSAALLKLLQKP